MASVSYSGRFWAIAETVVTEPAQAHQGAGLAEGDCLFRQVEGCLDVRAHRRDLVRGGRVGDLAVADQVAFGHADAADVHGAGGADGVVADHELRGAAADVHDQVGLGEGQVVPAGQFRCRAGEGEFRLLVAGDDLRFDAEDVQYAADEVVAVGGVAGGRRGDEAEAFGAEFLDDRRVVAAGREGALQGLGGEAAGLVHALAEPDDRHPPVQVHELTRRRVHVGHEEADRVRTAVDGGDAGHWSSAFASTGSSTGSSAGFSTGFSTGLNAK